MAERGNRAKNVGLLEFSSRYVQAIPNYKTKMFARRACELVPPMESTLLDDFGHRTSYQWNEMR